MAFDLSVLNRVGNFPGAVLNGVYMYNFVQVCGNYYIKLYKQGIAGLVNFALLCFLQLLVNI